MAMQTVMYDDDGVTLVGSQDMPVGPTQDIVLLQHGFTGHRMELAYFFVDLARRLTARGAMVYRFDFRGCGESGGTFDAITVADQARQTHALLDFLRARHAEARLHLAGFSMGGLAASFAAAERDDLATLSLLAPAGNFAEVLLRNCAAGQPRPDGRYDLLALPIGLPLQQEAHTLDAWAPLSRIRVPTLVVQGSDDAAVPLAVGRRYAEQISGARWLAIEGADHIFGRIEARDVLAQAMSEHIGL